MKQKTLITVAAIATLIVVGFLWSRACGLDERYRQARLQYEGYRAIAEADHEVATQNISQLTNELGQRDAKISALEQTIVSRNNQVSALRRDIAELQANEPVQPELEKEPLVINLRGQVKTLTEMFTLAQETIKEKDDIIREWEAKFDTQVKITLEWKAEYDREHALRVHAEELFKLGEKRVGLNKTIKNIALAVAGASVAYGLLK